MALLGLSGLPARAVDVDWVTIDLPGNVSDDEVMTCCAESIGLTGFGRVDYVYRIGRTEVTNAQYAEFLNAVARSELADDDPKQLFNPRLEVNLATILQDCVGGECTYEVTPGVEDHPVAYVDFFKALRFANWLHNGQPGGPQDATTTEDGAYTLLGSNPLDVARNAGALFALPSEDEWYKAAFYDSELQCYWDFATGTNDDLISPGTQKCPNGELVPSLGAPPGQPTTVTVNYGCCDPPGRNCDALAAVCDTTDVGAYVHSPSTNGSFDQAGNLNEWTEGVNETLGISTRVLRGGSSHRGANDLKSTSRPPANPNSQLFNGVGFRVTAVPEPGAGRIVALGLVLGLSLRRRRRLASFPAAGEARSRSRA
jgi:formylglycine-generating enzyme required for sulfatase activity